MTNETEVELLADISVTCPQCREEYRMRGVQAGQDLICFKCGQLFEAKEEIMNAVIDTPIKNIKEVVLEREKPKRHQGGSWTWLLFFTFILFCLFKIAMGPTQQIPPANESTAMTSPQEIPAAPALPEATVELAAPIAPPGELLTQAQTYFDSKEFEKAAGAFESYLAGSSAIEEKEKLELLWKCAMSHEKAGHAAAAIQWYQQILQEFGKEKDFKIHSARKALSRLEGAAQ